MLQHTYGHHSFTNDFDLDPDVHHFEAILRMHLRNPHSALHRLLSYRFVSHIAPSSMQDHAIDRYDTRAKYPVVPRRMLARQPGLTARFICVWRGRVWVYVWWSQTVFGECVLLPLKTLATGYVQNSTKVQQPPTTTIAAHHTEQGLKSDWCRDLVTCNHRQ